MKYLNTDTNQYVLNINTVWDENNYCTPAALVKDGKAEEFGIVEVIESSQPDYNAISQRLVETAVKQPNGTWVEHWEVVNLTPEEILINADAKAASDLKLQEDKIEALWQAADRYTSSFISGVAIGILTIGVLQQKPKALAVSDWSSRVWAEYYVRKSQVTKDSIDNHDFSSFGDIPYSVPELQEELGF